MATSIIFSRIAFDRWYVDPFYQWLRLIFINIIRDLRWELFCISGNCCCLQSGVGTHQLSFLQSRQFGSPVCLRPAIQTGACLPNVTEAKASKAPEIVTQLILTNSAANSLITASTDKLIMAACVPGKAFFSGSNLHFCSPIRSNCFSTGSWTSAFVVISQYPGSL